MSVRNKKKNHCDDRIPHIGLQVIVHQSESSFTTPRKRALRRLFFRTESVISCLSDDLHELLLNKDSVIIGET